jgi:cyclic pyranopterin phosphate synthase
LSVLKDKYGRIHSYLRVSLTDKCNLNCSYCNPKGGNGADSLKSELLSYEEMLRLIGVFIKYLGINKIRLTGGEPLIRKQIDTFITALNEFRNSYPVTFGITTNGILLKNKIDLLKENGFEYVNISLDTLDNDMFKKITGSGALENVIESIQSALEKGLKVKLNTVVMKGVNTNEIKNFLNFALNNKVNIRFIEYMPFSGNGWNKERFISIREIMEIVKSYIDILPAASGYGSAAKDYLISGTNVKIGFISSISDDFCGECNRLRITSDGMMKLCLFSSISDEINLKKLLRDNSYSDIDISEIIKQSILEKKYKHPGIDELLQADKNNMIRIGG